MKKPTLIRILVLLLAAACWLGAAQDLASQIEQIMGELSRISGLKPLRKIEHARITREQVKAFLEQRIKEEIQPEEIRAEELTLKKFGLAPAEFDLKKTTIELLTEQAAAFYDFRKRKLFLIDSSSEMVQRTALVHELAHALADQHFNLQRFIERVKQNDDRSMARLAVMEGQASWLMSEYLTQRSGQSLKESPVLLKMMSHSVESAAGQYPVFDRAPLYLQQTLLFPYRDGMLFQHAVIEKLGLGAFTEVFRRPPESTQQVLEPDKYLAGVKPVTPALPALVSERNYRSLVDGTFGQLDHAILLRQYAGEEQSDALAPAWRGGAYKLLEHKQGGRLVLLFASQWNGQEAAQKFFRLYQQVLKGKWKSYQPGAGTSNSLSGRGDDGWFLLRLDGALVSSLEGMASVEEAKTGAATVN